MSAILTQVASNNAAGVTNINGYVGYSATPTRLVLVGDSLTAGAYGSTNGGYSGWLTNSSYGLLPVNYFIVTNGGLSGKKLTTMAANYATEIAPYAPSGGTNAIAIIWGGVNDLVAGTNAAGLYTQWSNLVTSCKSGGFDVMAMTITMNELGTNEVERITFNSMIRNSQMWDYFVDLSWVPKPYIKGFHYDNVHFYDRMHQLQAGQIADAFKRPKRTIVTLDRSEEHNYHGGKDNYRGFAYSLASRSDTYPFLMLEKPGGDIYFQGLRLSKIAAAMHVGSGSMSWPSEALYEMDLSGINFYSPLSVLGNGGTSNTVAYFSVPTSTKTGNYSITVTENNTWFNNNGASGSVTLTLPAATVGRQYGVSVLAAQTVVLKASGTDTIRVGSVVSAAGGQAATNVIGSTIHVYCPVKGNWISDYRTLDWAVQ